MNYTLFKEKINAFEFSQNYIIEGNESFSFHNLTLKNTCK